MLRDEIFGAEVNEGLMHQAVRMYLNNRRAGTAKAKSRGEVGGTTRKPWRQKGLGRARAGSVKSPLWRGGGVTFPPSPRDGFKMPRKARRAALKSALSAKVRDGEFMVLDSLTIEKPSTKSMAELLQRLQLNKKALIVTAGRDRAVDLSARNLPGVGTAAARMLNVYDVLSHDVLVITKDAVASIEEVLLNEHQSA